MCYCMLWPWSCNTPKVTLIHKQTHTHTQTHRCFTETALVIRHSLRDSTHTGRHTHFGSMWTHATQHACRYWQRSSLLERPSTSVCFGEELFKCGTTADGGLEWRSERWGNWRCGKPVSGAEFSGDSNYFSLLVFDTCQGTSVKTLQLAEQNDIERERVSVLGIDW